MDWEQLIKPLLLNNTNIYIVQLNTYNYIYVMCKMVPSSFIF